jgi:hypothetical protein
MQMTLNPFQHTTTSFLHSLLLHLVPAPAFFSRDLHHISSVVFWSHSPSVLGIMGLVGTGCLDVY